MAIIFVFCSLHISRLTLSGSFLSHIGVNAITLINNPHLCGYCVLSYKCTEYPNINQHTVYDVDLNGVHGDLAKITSYGCNPLSYVSDSSSNTCSSKPKLANIVNGVEKILHLNTVPTPIVSYDEMKNAVYTIVRKNTDSSWLANNELEVNNNYQEVRITLMQQIANIHPLRKAILYHTSLTLINAAKVHSQNTDLVVETTLYKMTYDQYVNGAVNVNVYLWIIPMVSTSGSNKVTPEQLKEKDSISLIGKDVNSLSTVVNISPHDLADILLESGYSTRDLLTPKDVSDITNIGHNLSHIQTTERYHRDLSPKTNTGFFSYMSSPVWGSKLHPCINEIADLKEITPNKLLIHLIAKYHITSYMLLCDILRTPKEWTSYNKSNTLFRNKETFNKKDSSHLPHDLKMGTVYNRGPLGYHNPYNIGPGLHIESFASRTILCSQIQICISKRYTGRTPTPGPIKDLPKIISNSQTPVSPPMPPITYGKRYHKVTSSVESSSSMESSANVPYKPRPRSPDSLSSIKDKIPGLSMTPPQPPNAENAPNTNWGSLNNPWHMFKRNAPRMGYTTHKVEQTPVIDPNTGGPLIDLHTGKPVLESTVVTGKGLPIPQHEATHTILRDNETGLDVGLLTSAKNVAKGNLYVAPENYKGQTLPDGSPKPQYLRPYDIPRYSKDASNMVEDPLATAFVNKYASVIDGHLDKTGTATKRPDIRTNKNSSQHYHENGLPIYDSAGNEIQYEHNYETPQTTTKPT